MSFFNKSNRSLIKHNEIKVEDVGMKKNLEVLATPPIQKIISPEMLKKIGFKEHTYCRGSREFNVKKKNTFYEAPKLDNI